MCCGCDRSRYDCAQYTHMRSFVHWARKMSKIYGKKGDGKMFVKKNLLKKLWNKYFLLLSTNCFSSVQVKKCSRDTSCIAVVMMPFKKQTKQKTNKRSETEILHLFTSNVNAYLFQWNTNEIRGFSLNFLFLFIPIKFYSPLSSFFSYYFPFIHLFILFFGSLCV